MRKFFLLAFAFLLCGLFFSTSVAAGSKNILQIESDPVGSEVILRKEGSKRKYKSCKTPCELQVKPDKGYDLKAVLPDGGFFDLPVEFPTKRMGFGGDDYLDVKV